MNTENQNKDLGSKPQDAELSDTNQGTPIGRYAGLGIELPACIVIGLFGGMWVGSLFNHKTAGVIIGLGIGLFAAFRTLLRIIQS